MKNLFREFRRRNVLRAAALYLISAWLIAQVADVVIGLGELPASIGRAVLIILATGFPVALAVSWFFEWTPEGILLESGANTGTHTARSGGRRIDHIIIALLSVALVYFVATHDWQESPRVAGVSIAVLPFENRSALAEDDYFVNGIHDDILTQLSKIGSLVVISRTSVMHYRNSDKTIPEIARELGVATILEGGVQRAGQHVRINLQLIDAVTDKHLWAESYDRDLTAQNVFAIQSEIATAIANTLHAQLLPAEREQIAAVPTGSLEAYDAYSLGRRYFEGRSLDELTKAREYFERAIALDPDFAVARTGLSQTLVLLTLYYGNGSDSLADFAEQEARKAMDLDPGLGESYTALAMVLRLKGEPADIYGPLLKRGVELSPGSADARKQYANFLWGQGQHENALEQMLKAVQLDPIAPMIRVNLASVLRKLGRDEEASIQLDRALEIDPNFLPAIGDLMKFAEPARQLSMISRAIKANSDGSRPYDSWLLVNMVWGYLSLRDDVRARQWLDELDRTAPASLPTLIGHLNLNLYRGQEADALVFANKLLPMEQAGRVTVPSRTLLLHDLKQGNLTQALKRYEEKYPELLTDVASFTDDHYMCAIDVAMLLQALGEPEKANRLFDLSLQYMNSSLQYMDSLPKDEIREFGVLKARIHALRGNRQEALAALEEAMDAGWRFQWWFYLEQDPAFDSLREDPRFQRIADEMAARVRGELETVRQMEASGEVIVPPLPRLQG